VLCLIPIGSRRASIPDLSRCRSNRSASRLSRHGLSLVPSGKQQGTKFRVRLRHSNPTLVPLSVTVETALRRALSAGLERGRTDGTTAGEAGRGLRQDEDMETRFGRTCDGFAARHHKFLARSARCAIALDWNKGLEIRELPVKSEIIDGSLNPTVFCCRNHSSCFATTVNRLIQRSVYDSDFNRKLTDLETLVPVQRDRGKRGIVQEIYDVVRKPRRRFRPIVSPCPRLWRRPLHASPAVVPSVRPLSSRQISLRERRFDRYRKGNEVGLNVEGRTRNWFLLFAARDQR